MVSLKDQVACVEREIKMRLRVYPGLVAKGKMKPEEMEREFACMRAVLETLRSPAVLSQYAASTTAQGRQLHDFESDPPGITVHALNSLSPMRCRRCGRRALAGEAALLEKAGALCSK